MNRTEDDATLRLWIEIVRLANGLQKDVDSRLRRTHGQTLTRFDVLSQLDRVPEHQLSVGELSARLLTASAGITRLLDRMERDGLIERTLAPEDRRRFNVRATAAGLALFERMAADNREWIRDAFDQLSSAQRNALREALDALADR